MPDTDYRSITPRRRHAGLSQEELAQRAGIRRQSLNAYESGKAEPPVGAALSIAQVLQCTVDQLFLPIPLETLIAWSNPDLIDSPAHRALLLGKTPFIIAGRHGAGKSTFLDSVLAKLGGVIILDVPGREAMYTPPGSITLALDHPKEDVRRTALRHGTRAIAVPELLDAEMTTAVTAIAREASLPIYTTLYAEAPAYIGERIQRLTAGDVGHGSYWGTPGVIWVDQQRSAITVEKLFLIEPASADAIHERFASWCAEVNALVTAVNRSLEYAWGAYQWPGARVSQHDLGYFSNQGRFVNMSAMRDGRILISGLESSIHPIEPGGRIPRAKLLFQTNGLATMISMDEIGADLAARAIVAWLSFADDTLPEIRRAFDAHVATPLTLHA